MQRSILQQRRLKAVVVCPKREPQKPHQFTCIATTVSRTTPPPPDRDAVPRERPERRRPGDLRRVEAGARRIDRRARGTRLGGGRRVSTRTALPTEARLCITLARSVPPPPSSCGFSCARRSWRGTSSV